MKKSLFIKNEVRKVINIKNNGTTVKFKIYNPNDASKKAVFDMYEKKEKQGLSDFSLSSDEVRLMLNLFTDCLFSIDELSEILDNPSLYFEQIMNEIEIILGELSILYIQEKTKMFTEIKIEEAILNMNEEMLQVLKRVDIDSMINELAETSE